MMKNIFKPDVKMAMKNIPESIDFKFFDQLNKQNNNIIVEVRQLRRQITNLKNITKFKIMVGASFATFIITTLLAATTEYDEFIIGLIRSIFPV